jgi:Bardet-Biedl syndrome 5 protein
VEEDTELVEDQEDSHAVAAYYADSTESGDSKFESIQYHPKLGLAMEGLQDGMTLDQLWRVV